MPSSHLLGHHMVQPWSQGCGLICRRRATYVQPGGLQIPGVSTGLKTGLILDLQLPACLKSHTIHGLPGPHISNLLNQGNIGAHYRSSSYAAKILLVSAHGKNKSKHRKMAISPSSGINTPDSASPLPLGSWLTSSGEVKKVAARRGA